MDEFKVWWLANSDTFFVKEYNENVKAAIHFFKKFDDDLSGELDQMEFVGMCKEMGWSTHDTAMSLVMLDTDGDGMISFQEFLAWYSDDGMSKNLIKVYSRRGTESLNLEEFTMLAKDWKLDAPTAAKVFRKYDKDKDGELNMEELKVVIEKTKS
jgi:Ca2+-binding EF-hand superfamily protein